MKTIYRSAGQIVVFMPEAFNEIRAAIAGAGDKDTGGLLVGGFFHSATLVLHAVAPPVPGEPRAAMVASAALRELLDELGRELGGRLFYLGEWQSSPHADPHRRVVDPALPGCETISLVIGGPGCRPVVRVCSAGGSTIDLAYSMGPTVSHPSFASTLVDDLRPWRSRLFEDPLVKRLVEIGAMDAEAASIFAHECDRLRREAQRLHERASPRFLIKNEARSIDEDAGGKPAMVEHPVHPLPPGHRLARNGAWLAPGEPDPDE